MSISSASSVVVKTLSSKYFFPVTILLFIIQCIWIALSAAYPMLFDEHFHMGVIEIYSRQLSPFISSQPPEAAIYGDITRLPSYLYHYLMSFPYRIIEFFTNDFMTQVILLRLLNIAIFTYGIVLFRKAFMVSKVPVHVVNVAILFFILIPIIPFIASHINYDSLMFVVVAMLFYLSLKVLENNKKLILYVGSLFIVGMLGSIVKFTVLPIFGACSIFVLIALYYKHRKNIKKYISNELRHTNKYVSIIVFISLLISSLLFIERYGVNIIQYGTLLPKCDQVQPVESCLMYGPYGRDANLSSSYAESMYKLEGPIGYTFKLWLPHIVEDLFVTAAYIDDPPLSIHESPEVLQASRGSPVLRIAGWVVLISGLVITAMLWKRIRYKMVLYLFSFSFALYTSSLWLTNYGDYKELGVAVATQGRYFVPFLMGFIIMFIASYSVLLNKRSLKIALLVVGLLIAMCGGGLTTYIVYSKSNWYGDVQLINNVNTTLRPILTIFTEPRLK